MNIFIFIVPRKGLLHIILGHFLLWILFNLDDNFDLQHELQIVSKLAVDYDLENNG